jgi:hypothetical protein
LGGLRVFNQISYNKWANLEESARAAWAMAGRFKSSE